MSRLEFHLCSMGINERSVQSTLKGTSLHQELCLNLYVSKFKSKSKIQNFFGPL